MVDMQQGENDQRGLSVKNEMVLTFNSWYVLCLVSALCLKSQKGISPPLWQGLQSVDLFCFYRCVPTQVQLISVS